MTEDIGISSPRPLPGADSQLIDRVRANTSEGVNRTLDMRAEDRVRGYAGAGPAEMSVRIEELEQEWSIERLIETEASAMGLMGLGLGLTYSRKFLLVPTFVASMVLLHGLQGWYPMLPLFRRLGFRTREEIEREKFALKVLRGDFNKAISENGSTRDRAARALEAVRV
jgi:hypothetical protein